MPLALPLLAAAAAASTAAADPVPIPVALRFDVPRDQAVQRAESAMAAGPFSVTHKTVLAPSGDPHDYASLAPYWWPDPRKPDGLPYVRKDGVENPEWEDPSFTDHDRFQELAEAVGDLAVGYAATADERYARHAAHLVRVWFTEAETKMNPHLDFAQSVRGRSSGRPYGIIDTHRMPEVIDAVETIAGIGAWSASDDDAFRDWCTRYLTWLRESDPGKKASATENNHGSWYDAQVVRLAVFLGQDDLARTVAEAARGKRVLAHIQPDGSQPRELARTRSYDYSLFNLHGLALVARAASRVGVDLWDTRLPTGEPALAKALAYVESELEGGWTHEQISPPDPAKLDEVRRLFPAATAGAETAGGRGR